MAMQTLKRIQPLHPQLVPPDGAEAAGVTEHGHQLYKMTRKMARSKPAVDEDGNPRHRYNRITGEQMNRINEPVIYEQHLLFYLHSQGNGNIELVQYQPPTQEELEERVRKEKVDAMLPAVAAALVDGGLTAEKIQEWVNGGTAGPAAVPEPDPEPQPAEPEAGQEEREADAVTEYPVDLKFGRWELSDGTRLEKTTKEDAVAAEEKVQADREETRAAMDAVPEL